MAIDVSPFLPFALTPSPIWGPFSSARMDLTGRSKTRQQGGGEPSEETSQGFANFLQFGANPASASGQLQVEFPGLAGGRTLTDPVLAPTALIEQAEATDKLGAGLKKGGSSGSDDAANERLPAVAKAPGQRDKAGPELSPDLRGLHNLPGLQNLPGLGLGNYGGFSLGGMTSAVAALLRGSPDFMVEGGMGHGPAAGGASGSVTPSWPMWAEYNPEEEGIGPVWSELLAQPPQGDGENAEAGGGAQNVSFWLARVSISK